MSSLIRDRIVMEAISAQITELVDSMISSDVIAVPDCSQMVVQERIDTDGENLSAIGQECRSSERDSIRLVSRADSTNTTAPESAALESAQPMPDATPQGPRFTIALDSIPPKPSLSPRSFTLPASADESFKVGDQVEIKSRRPRRTFCAKVVAVHSDHYVVEREVDVLSPVDGAALDHTVVSLTSKVRDGDEQVEKPLSEIRAGIPPKPLRQDFDRLAFGPEVMDEALDAYRQQAALNEVSNDDPSISLDSWQDKDLAGLMAILHRNKTDYISVVQIRSVDLGTQSLEVRWFAHDTPSDRPYDFYLDIRSRTGILPEFWVDRKGGQWTTKPAPGQKVIDSIETFDFDDVNILVCGAGHLHRGRGPKLKNATRWAMTRS